MTSPEWASDGGKPNTWTRRLSDAGKINFPPVLRSREFLLIEPGAIETAPPSEIHLYPIDEPPTINGTVTGEIRRGHMRKGQITIPREFRRKSEFPMSKVEVTVIKEDNKIRLTDPVPVSEIDEDKDKNPETNE
jgi:hypothetical protein